MTSPSLGRDFSSQIKNRIEKINSEPDPRIYFPSPDSPPKMAHPIVVRTTDAGCLTLWDSGTLDQRLCGHPGLRGQIIWETGTGERIPYDFWTRAQKDRLNEFFQRMIRGKPDLGMHLPDPRRNMNQRPFGSAPGTLYGNTRVMYLTQEEAFDSYAVHLAHVLYLEATRRVPWSIFALPPDELAQFTSSDRYQSRIVPIYTPHSVEEEESYYRTQGYPEHIRPNRDFQLPFRINNLESRGIGLLGDPRDGFNFMTGRNSTAGTSLLGATEEETLENLTLWFSQNIGHGRQLTAPPENTIEYYVGHNFLRDRLRREERVYVGGVASAIIAPTGCHSASNLFRDLARSVNIPILNINYNPWVPALNGGRGDIGTHFHQGLVFRWARSDTRILFHTDEIYANGYYPFFPLDEIGGRLSEREAKRLYFNVHWMTPSALSSYGYELPCDFTLRRREDFLSYPWINTYDESEFGVYGGGWIVEGGEDLLHLEKQYLLCPYADRSNNLLKTRILSGRLQMEETLDQLLSDVGSDFALRTRIRARSQYSDQIEAALSNYGREPIVLTFDEFIRNYGAHQWLDDR